MNPDSLISEEVSMDELRRRFPKFVDTSPGATFTWRDTGMLQPLHPTPDNPDCKPYLPAWPLTRNRGAWQMARRNGIKTAQALRRIGRHPMLNDRAMIQAAGELVAGKFAGIQPEEATE